jgi:mannose-6-phosphate isomerase-like protein (cupin superfamily)
MSKQAIDYQSDFPAGLSNPARRALAGAGYWRLEQLAAVNEAELARLHGMGPKGIRLLRSALAEKGLSFSGGSSRAVCRVIRAGEIAPSPGGTITFEGEPYGSAVSFFHVNTAPGTGPVLHRHPYPETWIVRAGKARFRAGDLELEAGEGDILVVSAETPHKFTNIGEDRLEIICIHASTRIIQEDLE